jgi:hypothetical protein
VALASVVVVIRNNLPGFVVTGGCDFEMIPVATRSSGDNHLMP